jgi:sigma-B regulation protein RsbU (phosphoserine phosphatase)
MVVLDAPAILGALVREADSAPPDALSSVVSKVLPSAGFTSVVLYVIDYDCQTLIPAPGTLPGSTPLGPLSIEHSEAGRAYRDLKLVEREDGGAHCVWTPVIERSDCLGVLELHTDRIDDDLRRLSIDAAILIGHLIVTSHGYTDAYETAARTRDMSLAAEMHWELQPAMVYSAPGLSLAGGIEPAYEVGGDAFDYSFNLGVLDLALIDAMGHGLEASLLSVQAVAAYRWARRRGKSLAEMGETLEQTFLEQFDGEKFVTGLLSRLDCFTGTFNWVNAGHLPPLLLRDGRVKGELDGSPGCPLGLDLGNDFTVGEIGLKPGDGIVLYSDGLIEARSPDGTDFEVERVVAALEREFSAAASTADIVRSTIADVKAHSRGPLRDDATIVLVQYRP